MTDPASPQAARYRVAAGLLRGGTQWLLLGSVLGGVAAYLFQVVGARALGEEAYAPIGTLWTIQYLSWSIFLYAVETYVNREVVVGRVGNRMRGGAILRTAGWIAAVALALTATTWVLREPLFYGVDDLALVAGLIVLGYGAFAVVRGRFAGAGRFKAYGFVTASESVIRLGLAVAVVLLTATTRALAWIMPAGALAAAAWWFVLGRRRGEHLDKRATRPEAPRTGRFLVLTTAGNAAVQVLLAGAPLVMVALAASPAAVSVVFVTMTAARVPVVLALGGLLSRMLPTFVRVLRERGDAAGARLATRITLATLLVAAAGAAAGAVAGEPLVALFFGAGFAPPWWFAAATGGGVLLATGGMLLNQLLVARGLEHRVPAPWFAGLATGAATIVVTAGAPMVRVAAGFIVGEVAALVLLTLAARLPRRSVPSSGSRT